MIDGKKVFDHPVKNYLRAYDNIRKIATGQGDDYTTACLLDYSKNNTIEQINFTGNLDEDKNTTMFFIIEEAK